MCKYFPHQLPIHPSSYVTISKDYPLTKVNTPYKILLSLHPSSLVYSYNQQTECTI